MGLDILQSETRRYALQRFLILIAIVILYAAFVMYKYGAKEGLLITALTWAFFVFCTPIADAGFLLAFPTRLLLGIRMIYTQIAAYFIAGAITEAALLFAPQAFNKTILLYLFKTILLTPWPYWILLVLSLIGTFASIIFGDELIDVATHKERTLYHKHYNKYRLFIMVFIFIGAILLYGFLIEEIGINIPLF